ncbi:MAG: hypothetical protein ACE5FN_10285 [Leptospirillia bacterium]
MSQPYWIIIPNQPGLSVLLLAVLAITVLYLGRTPAHEAIRAAARVLGKAFRLSARSVSVAQGRLIERNRQVLLASGLDAAERMVEREFERVGTAVRRDLGAYPALHRKLSDQVTKVDEDYREATDAPPPPPGWTEALSRVADLSKAGDPSTAPVLKAIHKGMKQAHDQAIGEYRTASGKRHTILKGLQPYWRRVDETLEGMSRNINGLAERARLIDAHMERYEGISTGSRKAERALSSSSLTHFFVSGLVLVIAIMGGLINFNLIALPMSEMVGAGSHIGNFRISDVAAMVIIMVEVAMGLFLMESLRITNLFPVIHALDDRMRRRMIWVTFAILFTLAGVEASLAYMRDLLAADREALTHALAGTVALSNPEFRWIPSLGQMVMGFVLPFALTFVAIPLESFVASARTVLGVLGAGALRALAFLLRLTGQVLQQMGDALVAVYDLAIFVPLRIEAAVASMGKRKTNTPSNPAREPVSGGVK